MIARRHLAILFICLLHILLSACDDKKVTHALGTLERDRIELMINDSEPIVQVLVQEGQQVKKGDLLLQLDTHLQQARLEQLVAQLQQHQERLAELIRGPRSEAIAQARASLNAAESHEAEAKINFDRIQTLVTRGLMGKANLDEARAAFETASAQRLKEQENVKEKLTGTTQEELGQANANVKQVEALINQQEIIIERLSIRASRDGVVDNLPYNLGEQPPPLATLVVLLADGQPYARVYVPQSHRNTWKIGEIFPVKVENVDLPFTGRLRKIASDPVFTPFYALTERDRSRLTYIAELDLIEAQANTLATGLPVQVGLNSNE